MRYTLNDQIVMEGYDYDFYSKGEVVNYDLYPKLSIEELLKLKGKGLIPFYNKKNVAFMMIAGSSDQCVPAVHYADLFQILLQDSEHPNFEVYKYTDAGHLIEPPYGACNKVTRMYSK